MHETIIVHLINHHNSTSQIKLYTYQFLSFKLHKKKYSLNLHIPPIPPRLPNVSKYDNGVVCIVCGRSTTTTQ